MDPTETISVQDYSASTLQAIVAQLERSTSVDHLVYRESELDALWSLLDLEVRRAQRRQESEPRLRELRRLFDAAQDAHDLVGADDPSAAARRLRDIVRA
ncbi:MAG: hypothetical protein ACRDJE_27440 [Dehalococcoidia bacterium]